MAKRLRISPWPIARSPKPLESFDYPFARERREFNPKKMTSAIYWNLAGHPRRPMPERLCEWLRDPMTSDRQVVKQLFEDIPGSLLNDLLWNSGASIYEMARLFHHCRIDYWKTVVWIDQFSLDQSKHRGIPQYYECM